MVDGRRLKSFSNAAVKMLENRTCISTCAATTLPIASCSTGDKSIVRFATLREDCHASDSSSPPEKTRAATRSKTTPQPMPAAHLGCRLIFGFKNRHTAEPKRQHAAFARDRIPSAFPFHAFALPVVSAADGSGEIGGGGVAAEAAADSSATGTAISGDSGAGTWNGRPHAGQSSVMPTIVPSAVRCCPQCGQPNSNSDVSFMERECVGDRGP